MSGSGTDTATITELLLELHESQQATAWSNLLVGIVFGEQKLLLRGIVTANVLMDDSEFLRSTGAYVVFYGTSLYIIL